MLKLFVWILKGCPLYFAGISATAIAAGVGAAASVAGAASSMMSSGDAADAQVGAANSASAVQKKIADDQLAYLRESRDIANKAQQPFLDQGTKGVNKLGYLLGTSTGLQPYKAKALISVDPAQFTLDKWKATLGANDAAWMNKNGVQPDQMAQYNAWKNQGLAKQKALAKTQNPIIQKQNAASLKAYQTQVANIKKDPNFGMAAKGFTEKFKDPGAYKAPAFNFQADPGYQFRKDQGNRDLQGRLAQMGLTNSGAALKEGLKFNQGLADQTYNDAFNRYNTNRTFDYTNSQANRGFAYNQFSDNFNRYNANKAAILSPYQSMAGAGQSAATSVANTNQNYASQANQALGALSQGQSSNILAAGNAQAAGSIAQGNAFSNGANQLAGIAGRYAGYGGNTNYANKGIDASAWGG